MKFLSFIEDGVYHPQGFDHRLLLQRFSFNSLETRRNIILIKFLFKLLHEKVDCSQLVQKICFLVPRINSRQTYTFYIPPYRSNILLKAPLQSMCNKFNLISDKCDINADNFKTICNFLIDFMNNKTNNSN